MKTDLHLVVSTGLVILMGLLIHYSISRDSFNIHIIYMCIGLVGAFFASKIDYKFVRPFAGHLYITGVILLVVTLLLAAVTRGSRRWIDLGFFQFQSSEVLKLLMIVILPQWLVRLRHFQVINVIKTGLLVSVPVSLILAQPDLGTALILLFISFAMIFVAGLDWKVIILGVIFVIIVSPFLWLNLQDYQKDRINTFLNPLSDPLGKGYNSIQSQIAVGSGQLLGRGLGHGTQSKLRFLPEYQTDFVFASLAEELGFMGSSILLVAFSWLIARLIYLASISEDQYSALVLVGIAAMLLSQSVVNMGMNMGVLPVTGVTLPFVSAGGTSMIISLTSIGVAQGVSYKTKNSPGIEINGKDK